MRTRTSASRPLLHTALALPLLLAACGVATDPGESADRRAAQVVTESASDHVAFDYFVGKGLTDVQAAGIVGNLDQESGMSPTIAQYGGGPGRGIAQWSAGGRWDTSPNDNVTWYASQHGASRTSLALQLDFIWYELTTLGYGYSELRAATTVTEAVDAFQNYYEICGACDSSNRIADAEAALADFGGSPSPGGAGGTSCSAHGVPGTCLLTSTCAAMAGHVSTAGLCPGAADIECCTPTGSSSSGGSGTSGSSSSGGGGAPGSSSSGGGGSPGSSSSGGGGSSSSSSSGGGGSPAPACTVGGVDGTCIDTSVCATKVGYVSTPGYCPGAASEECCTPPPSCTVNGLDGSCIQTSACAAMGYVSTPGYCPGAATEECCTAH